MAFMGVLMTFPRVLMTFGSAPMTIQGVQVLMTYHRDSDDLFKLNGSQIMPVMSGFLDFITTQIGSFGKPFWPGRSCPTP
jgi:hypothetical protein